MKSPTFKVLVNSAKSSDDGFEPIAKLEVSYQKNNLAREKSFESLSNLVAEFNQKQFQPEKDKKKDYWGDFDALNNTDQIESIPEILQADNEDSRSGQANSVALSEIEIEAPTPKPFNKKPSVDENQELTDRYADDFEDDPVIQSKPLVGN